MTLALAPDAPRAGAFRTLLKAVLSGSAVAIVPIIVWNGLLIASQKSHAMFVWATPIMAAVLLAGAVWLRWGRWPGSGRAFRREGLRLNPVAPRVVLLALAAGWSTMIAGFCLYVAHRTALGMGGENPIALPNLPFVALLPGLVMAAIVAGGSEEIAFRGFMQGTLEKRFGVAPAIVLSGLVWALFHINHSYFGEETLVWAGVFLAVSAMLGILAARTNSVLPGMAVHIGFDAAYFIAAGLLQPRFAPVAWLQSFTTPPMLVAGSAVAALVALLSWMGFFRATKPG